MNILFLITGLGLGGAEKVVIDLAEKMYLIGHQVKVVYLKGDLVLKPKYTEIEAIGLGLEGILQLIPASKKYRALVKEFNPEVVHAHMVHANIFARLNRSGMAGAKLICTAHNSNEGGRLRMLAYRYTNYLSDINTNVSQEATERFIQLGAFNRANIFTVYNGIDLEKFKNSFVDKNKMKIDLGLDPDVPILLAVGRMNQQKDYPNLLHAVQQLIYKNNTPCHLIVAGDGELRSSIEALIIELNLSKYVKLLGKRNDIPDLMSLADLFVLPSAYEGFGLVVAEAMACECFVVATDCGGVKEVMGGHGILVPPQNALELTKSIQIALNMQDSEIKLNNNKALTHVLKKFNLNNIVDQWLEIYAAK